MDLLLKNGHIIDPASGIESVNDVLVRNGVIEKIAPAIQAPGGIREIDMTGKVVAPGFTDMHVHLREPGFEHKETIESGLLSAAAGGFTAVCCMPNTNPAIDDAGLVRDVIERGRRVHGGIVDLFPIAAVTRGREGKELSAMLELAEAGAVGFSDDGSPVSSAEVMRRALEYCAMTGRPLIQHAEETTLAKGGVMNEGALSTALGLPPIPPIAEELMVERDIRLARYAGARYHVAHISTAASVGLVRSAKAAGLAVTCEVTPHHLVLTEEAVRGYDTNTKMNPPLRTQEDVEAMKEGLRDGTIDAIATDHAPHTIDEKDVEYIYAPFGIIGLETAVGIAIKELVVSGILTLHHLIEKFSTNPRLILGLPPIRMKEGELANMTLLDPDLVWKVDPKTFKSRSRNTPFGGWTLQGRAIGIINHNLFYSVSS
jgi:dihydroorotase